MSKKLTSSQENYIKAIYNRHKIDGGISHISDIAVDMGLTKASVCRSIQVLEKKGLLEKDKYRALTLTSLGLEYTMFLEERYFIIVRLLNEVLFVDLDTAKEDACEIEHAISTKTYNAISALFKEKLKTQI